MTLFEIAAFILSPLVSFLEPYVNQVVQTLTSAALHRKLIKAFLAILALLMLIGFAVSAYVSFYWFYIPQRGHSGQVHLQYDRPSVIGGYQNGPSAEVDFTHGGKYSQFLRSDQAYDISMRLHVPTSERNVAIGNFMVAVTLLREDGTSIVKSSRPSILTYQSRPLRLMKTAWKAVPLVLDWSKEDQYLNVPLIEHYVEDGVNPVARAFVEISAPELQIYQASIHIDAHFSGLRYFMYYYKVATALAFISVFIFWEIVFSVVTWQLLATWFGSEAQQLALHPTGGAATTGAGVVAVPAGGAQGTIAQPQLTHQLRAPTPYQQQQSSGSRNAPAPRQPQLDDHRILETHGTDTEDDEEELLLTGEGGPSSSKSRYGFNHDEMEDDDEDNGLPGDDEAIVPQRGDRPQAPASLPAEGSASSTRHRSSRHHLPTVYQDDNESTTTNSSSRRSGSSGHNTHHLSMTSTSAGLTPPPPPPPSVLSEALSSERSHHQQQQRRSRGSRGMTEATVLEEDFGGAEGDNEDDEEDDLIFDEDFSESSGLSSPPLGSSSARNNSSSAARLRHARGVAGGGSGNIGGAGIGAGSS